MTDNKIALKVTCTVSESDPYTDSQTNEKLIKRNIYIPTQKDISFMNLDWYNI